MKTSRAAILVILVVVLGYWVLHSESSPSQPSNQSGATTSTVVRIAPNTQNQNQSQSNPPKQTTTTLAPAHPPGQVITLVANATQTTGAAQRFATALQVRGYNTIAPVDATSTVSASHVYYLPGYQPDAEVIAQALGLTPASASAMPATPPVSSIKTAKVLVIIGSDLASQPTTTTTAAKSG